MIGRNKSARLATLVLSLSLLLSACGNVGQAADPAQWGYTAAVTYHAMGGIINQREIRQTNYMPNSLLFRPSGTSNMLIEPSKEGSSLAGWYTAYTESTDADGNTVYEFDAQDRWDFNTDRVQGEMTLYARWVDTARGTYVDPETGEVVFMKNLTEDSPLQELSGAVSSLVSKEGHTLTGYYADEALTEPYDFSSYAYVELLPDEHDLYDQLATEFPENFLEYIPSDEDEVIASEPDDVGEELEEGEEGDEEIGGISEDADLHYLRSLGYELQADEEALANITYRKKEIIAEYIDAYIENNEHNTVYLQYTRGNSTLVRSAEDLKQGSDYGFFDTDGGKTYTLENDIDLDGIGMQEVPVFTGVIDGQDHTISNLTLTITASKKDLISVTEKEGALFGVLDGATIQNITFKDMVIEINLPNNISVTAAAIAINTINSTIENVHFDGLTIRSGRGDDGTSDYVLSDSYINNDGSTVSGLTGEGVIFEASDVAERILHLE